MHVLTNSHSGKTSWAVRITARVMTVCVLAGLLGGLTAIPVMAGVTGVSGTVSGGNCQIVISLSGNNAPDVVSAEPCQPGQNTCQVILENGNLPAPVSQTFNGVCDPFGSQKQEILNFINFADNEYASCTGLLAAPCAISNLLTALSSGNVVGTLIHYLTVAMGLPFYSQGSLTSWITTTHQNALLSIYRVMAALGVAVALLAGAFRLVAEAIKRGAAPGMLIVGVPIRIILATSAIGAFFEFAQWGIPIFNNLASGVYSAIGSGGVEKVFGVNGDMTAQAIVALAGAGVAGLLGVIIALLMMIYLFVMLIMRDVILGFGVALAPIAIGLAVFDIRNEMFHLWRNIFLGGLLMSLAGAVGVGVTFAIFGSLIQTSATGMDWLMAIIMLIGGLFMTTRLMNIVMRGSMSHRSPTSLLLGMSEGAIIGMGVRKAIGAGRSMVSGKAKDAGGATGVPQTSATRAQANTAAGTAAAAASMADAELGPAAPGSVLSAASLTTQAGLAGLPPGSLETALINDEKAQQVIAAATANLHPGTSIQARLRTMASSDIHRPVLNRLIENGVGKGQLISGVDPYAVKFAYSDDEMEIMTNMANEAARRAQAEEMGV
jgi:hypothetical protein